MLGGYWGEVLTINKWKRICPCSENVDTLYEELDKKNGINGSEHTKDQ